MHIFNSCMLEQTSNTWCTTSIETWRYPCWDYSLIKNTTWSIRQNLIMIKDQLEDSARLIFMLNQRIFLFEAKLLLLSSLSYFALPFWWYICWLIWFIMDNLASMFLQNHYLTKSAFFHLPTPWQILSSSLPKS